MDPKSHPLEIIDANDLMPVYQAAMAIGVHPNTVKRWIRENLLPAYAVGLSRSHVRLDDVRQAQAVRRHPRRLSRGEL